MTHFLALFYFCSWLYVSGLSLYAAISLSSKYNLPVQCCSEQLAEDNRAPCATVTHQCCKSLFAYRHDVAALAFIIAEVASEALARISTATVSAT